MQIKKINTNLNSIELFSIFKDRSFSFFLDSGMDHEKLGQYSFIGFEPFLIFESKNSKINICNRDSKEIEVSYGNPLDKIREILNRYHRNYQTDLPFIGGAVGFLGYDLCHHIEKLPRQAIDDMNIPDCFFGLYDTIIIVDHKHKEVLISSLGISAKEDEIIAAIEHDIDIGEKQGVAFETNAGGASDKVKANLKKEDYLKAIDKIKDYITEGDIYQVNMTQRFECNMKVSPFELYVRLRKINPAPFASFLNLGAGSIVSSSPERFIKLHNGRIETRPIKGTCPRGTTPEEDQKNREALLSSEKNKAELLMIVDLERNDIGRIAKPGTVKVTELFHLESYATVHHLVATVTGEICDGYDIVDCLKATFPGGSITGAPKIRAMEIIDELEPTTRNIYTGSIGYIGFDGNADFNIVIRTILCKDDKAYFQVGGGIVSDSQGELEFQESLDKAKALIKTLEM